MTHFGVREDFRTVIARVRQIGERNGVLGADIAAPATIAATGAGWLMHASGVDGIPEAYGDPWRDRFQAECFAGPGKCLEFRMHRRMRIPRRPQPVFGATEAFLQQSVLHDRAGPCRICKYARIGLQRHARVDQRASA